MELTIRQSDVSDFFQILKCLKDLTCAISKAWDSRISNMAFPGAVKVMKHDTLSNIMLERPGVLWKPLLDEKKLKTFGLLGKCRLLQCRRWQAPNQFGPRGASFSKTYIT